MPPRSTPQWVNAVEWVSNRAADLKRLAQRPVLWFDPNAFVLTDNEAAERTEVRAYVPQYAPLLHIVEQPSYAVAEVKALAVAAYDRPSRVTQLEWCPLLAITASNTNYWRVDIGMINEAGIAVGDALYTGYTKLSGSEASGNVAAGAVGLTAGLNVEIASGHRLIAAWSTTGSPADLPPSFWIFS